MRILIADSLDPATIDSLEAAGHECTVEPALSADDLPGRIGTAQILVVRSTKVTAATLNAASDLGLVVRAGSGLNTIDCDAASHRGITVANVPGANAIAVAELTFGLLLALDRRIVENTQTSRSGVWNKAELSKRARGLAGTTLGVVGLGAIGQAVAKRASAFDMSIRTVLRDGASQRSQDVINRWHIEVDPDIVTLASKVGVLSVHVPSGDATKGLIDRRVIDALPTGAILINTSRADVVDAEALLEALDADRLRAGLDVFPDEPGTGTADDWKSPLAAHRNVVSTHHIGASTAQAQRAVASGVVDIIAAHVARNG